MLVLARVKVAPGDKTAGASCAQLIAQTEEIINECLHRTLVGELSPPVLRDQGLVAGLRCLADYSMSSLPLGTPRSLRRIRPRRRLPVGTCARTDNADDRPVLGHTPSRPRHGPGMDTGHPQWLSRCGGHRRGGKRGRRGAVSRRVATGGVIMDNSYADHERNRCYGQHHECLSSEPICYD